MTKYLVVNWIYISVPRLWYRFLPMRSTRSERCRTKELDMTPDPAAALHPVPTLASDRRLLRNDVFEMLLERILVGALEPGARLKDADLTAWLRVSRTPVREALSRLVGIGLVKTAPNRFTVVAPIVEREVADAVVVLRRLYPDAISAALTDLGDDAEFEISLLAGRLERDAEQNAVETFHRILQVLLGSLCNEVLAEAVESIHLSVLRYLRLVPSAAGALPRERVLGFAAALRARDDRAVGIIERVLDDLERALDVEAVPTPAVRAVSGH
jgi:DNA-binding GntR family transcriptional regulator